jgi:CHAT domain-containing protein
MLLENAEFHSSQQQVQAAGDFLQQAFAVLRDQANFAILEDAHASAYFRLADRLIRDCEEIGRWQLSAEARQTIAPYVKSHFEEGWEWIVRLEQRQLVEVQKIAAATLEQQQLIGELRARTSHLSLAAEADFRTLESSDTQRMTQAFETTIEVLGEQNLVAANYRHAAARYFEREQQFQTALLSEQYAASTFLGFFGANHPESARACVQFARIGRQIGAYQLSQQMLELALPTLTEIQGEQSRDTLSATLELAKLLVDVKDFSAALPLAQTAERNFALVWGENSVDYGEALGVLGLVFQGMNESAVAAEYLARSHEILSTRLDPTDSRLLRSAAWAAIARAREATSLADSIPVIEAVLQQYRESQQTHLIDYVALLVDYGDVLLQHVRYEQALEVFELAFNSVVELDGMGDDVQRAAIGQRLGITFRQLGQLPEAAANLEAAAKIQREIFGEQSSALCETLFQQAIVSHLMADHQLAATQVLASLHIEQGLLANIGFLLSDKSLSSLLAKPENRLSLLLRQLLVEDAVSAVNVEQAFYWTLQRKGLSLDVACRLRSLQQSRLYDSNVVRLAGRVGLLNQQMADLALLSTDKQTLSEIRQQQASLAREIATTNSELSLALKGEDTQLFRFSDDTNAVRKQLPAETVFIEYVRVEDIRSLSAATPIADRYLGFMLNADAGQPLVMKDLGPALEIDQLIEELRAETREFSRALSISSEESLETKYQEIAHRLYTKLLGPFGDACLQCKTLIIGPDSNISLVPFAALVSPQQRYLVEDLDICYVSSSRDLLRESAYVGKGTTIIANPNYDADLQSRQTALMQIEQQSDLRSLLVTRGEEELQTRALRWRRLPGAEQEANAVAEILADTPFGPVKKYLGTEAAEEVLKAAQSPRIVHLATHGFYVPLDQDTKPEENQTRSINFVSGLAKLRTDNNPLLRSGIVFAGANRVAQPQTASQMAEDGWLTAQEIAGMDFRNTELLVLSACESGLGDSTNGQGLQGICRAFTSAGAHAVLTSLFEVPDTETRDLMCAFYENFVSTQRRVAAINQAQRQQIDTRRQQHNAAHPFYWASFIMLSGAEH